MKYNFKNYLKFYNKYKYDYVELIEKDGNVYYNDFKIRDKTGKIFSTDVNVLNLGYRFKNSICKGLSNLFPYEFKFKGKKVNSIEGVLQGIKYKNTKLQNLILKYSGLDAYHTRGANELDFWGKTNQLFWQSKAIDRMSDGYKYFLLELYFSAGKNILFKKMLLSTGNKKLIHDGCTDINLSVLTRREYEFNINLLRDFINICEGVKNETK